MTPLDQLLPRDFIPTGEDTDVGYWYMVPEWSLAGNDKYGDCTFAALANFHDLVTAVNGKPEVMSEAEAEHFYSIETGFTPMDLATDRGAMLDEVLEFWQQHGWPGDPLLRPLGYCKIELADIPQAINGLGAVIAWCMVPDNDDPFVEVEGAALYPHAVLLVESSPTELKLVSWAEVYTVTKAWWEKHGRDCYAVRHPAWHVGA